MRALAGLGVHLRQRRLDDPARPRDLVPAHRDAEPGVGRAPAAEADQQVGAAGLDERAVEPLDLAGDRGRQPGLEARRARRRRRRAPRDGRCPARPTRRRRARGRGELLRRRPRPPRARRAAAGPAGSRSGPARPAAATARTRSRPARRAPPRTPRAACAAPARAAARSRPGSGRSRGRAARARPVPATRRSDVGVVGRGGVAQRAVRLGLGEAARSTRYSVSVIGS